MEPFPDMRAVSYANDCGGTGTHSERFKRKEEYEQRVFQCLQRLQPSLSDHDYYAFTRLKENE